MAALTRIAVCCVLLCAAGQAAAQCQFQNGEYTDPFAPGCADRILEYTENQSSDTQLALGYPVPVPVDVVEAGDYFRTLDALHAGYQAMLLDHGDIVHGIVAGQSHGGEDIWAYRIGTAGGRTVYDLPKGAVMVLAGTHAREWQPPEVVAEVFERAVVHRDDGGIGQYLVDNLVVVLVPMVNPDGFRQTQRFPAHVTADERQPRDGRMRRKNMHRPDTGGGVDDSLVTTQDNFFGVDLNRNHPYGFQSNSRNQSTHSLIYAGDEPQSEAESKAVMNAVELAPGRRLRLFMDIHSFTQVYFAPNSGNARRDAHTEDLATAMRAVTGFKYRYAPGGGHIGTFADFFAREFQAPSWTLETEPLNGGTDYGGTGVSHSGFVTPDSHIARLRDELAATSLLGFYRQAGPPAVIAIDIRDTDGELVWSADRLAAGDTARELSHAADGALEPGAGYTLWIAFDKPMRWRENGAVEQFEGQDVRLMPSVRLEVAGDTRNREIDLDAANGRWLDAPGPGPDGFFNYRDDAFALEFTLPGDLSEAATPALLVIEAEDMAGLGLDAEPATAADWDAGWVRYEGLDGAPSAGGGPDCTLRLWIGAGERGTHDLTCNAHRDAQPLPPPPPEPDPPRRSGGGASDAAWLLTLIALLAVFRRSAPAPRVIPPPGTSGH